MGPVIAVALGGACGCVVRHVVNGWSERVWPRYAPAGTFIVNVAGCLLIGAIMAYVHDRPQTSRESQALLVTGFLGGMTTFSAFGYQTVELMLVEQYRAALLNVAANLGCGLLAVWLGMRFVKACL